MNKIAHRDLLGEWLNENNMIGSGCEIGCAFGGYARIVLNSWKGREYHMVDPWDSQPETEYRERQESPDRYATWWQEVQDMAAKDPRIVLHRATSFQAAQTFPDKQLDWAYIDGNHDYQHVLQDIDLWWTKVKPDGLLGGHDFLNKTDEGWFCEVELAVRRWCVEREVEFYVTPCFSWWIHKKIP